MRDPVSNAAPRRFSRGFVFALLSVLLTGAIFFLVTHAVSRRTADGRYIVRATPMTDDIRFLQQYVRIDTSNPPGRERSGADFIAAELKRRGIPAEIVESAPGRANIYARIRGRKPGKALLMFHHIDVVPADAKQWQHPPFGGVIANRMLWGRGTIDMKGFAAAHLAAFFEVARRGVPEHDVVFIGSADEEGGSTLGMKWLVEHKPEWFAGVCCAITEGGVTEIVGDRVTQYLVNVGGRQFVQMTARASDRDALRKARIELEPYFYPEDPDAIGPAVRDYLRLISSSRTMNGPLLADVEATVQHGKFWLLEQTHRQLTQNTVAATGPRAVGDHYELDIVLATVPDGDPQASIERVRTLVAKHGVELVMVSGVTTARISSPASPFFRHVAVVANRYFDRAMVIPMLEPYSTTDCRFVRGLGIDCYGVPAFRVNYFGTKGIHGIDEAVRLDWFADGVAFMKELVTGYAFQK